MSGQNNPRLKIKKRLLSLRTDPHPGIMGRIELKKRDSELERRGVCKEDITLEKMPPKIISVLLRGLMILGVVQRLSNIRWLKEMFCVGTMLK